MKTAVRPSRRLSWGEASRLTPFRDLNRTLRSMRTWAGPEQALYFYSRYEAPRISESGLGLDFERWFKRFVDLTPNDKPGLVPKGQKFYAKMRLFPEGWFFEGSALSVTVTRLGSVVLLARLRRFGKEENAPALRDIYYSWCTAWATTLLEFVRAVDETAEPRHLPPDRVVGFQWRRCVGLGLKDGNDRYPVLCRYEIRRDPERWEGSFSVPMDLKTPIRNPYAPTRARLLERIGNSFGRERWRE